MPVGVLEFLFVSLCSGSNGLRYEELPGEWFDYNKAFPTVTDFYGSSSANPSPTPSETADGETSPSSMDTTKMAEGTLKMYNACVGGGGIGHMYSKEIKGSPMRMYMTCHF